MSPDWAPAVTLSIVAVSAVAAIVLRGPVGKAVAQWISGWNHNEARWIEAKARASGAGGAEAIEQLRGEVEELRGQLVEVRLDFAERMLAKGRGADRIGSAGA
jgi:hypothetical protein